MKTKAFLLFFICVGFQQPIFAARKKRDVLRHRSVSIQVDPGQRANSSDRGDVNSGPDTEVDKKELIFSGLEEKALDKQRQQEDEKRAQEFRFCCKALLESCLCSFLCGSAFFLTATLADYCADQKPDSRSTFCKAGVKMFEAMESINDYGK